MSQKLALNSRADLLRYYQHGGQQALDALAPLAGFKAIVIEPKQDLITRQANRSSANLAKKKINDDEQVESTTPTQHYWVVNERERLAAYDQPDQAIGLPEAIEKQAPLTAEACRPVSDAAEPLNLLPLVSPIRLKAALRELLSQQQQHQLDVPCLVKQMANGLPLYRIPRSLRRRPAGRVCIIIDKNNRTLPFWQDFDNLCSQLVKKHGKIGLELRQIRNNPYKGYDDGFDDEISHDWQLPAADTQVLILSDMGLLGHNRVVQKRWLRLGKAFAKLGVKPLVLSPICQSDQTHDMQLYYQLLLWHKLSRFKPLMPCKPSNADTQSIERLLGLIAIAIYVEPELLRAIGYCLPASESLAGFEAAIWQHEHVNADDLSVSVKSEYREYYQRLFKNETAELQQQVIALIQQHHANQHPVIAAEELILAAQWINFSRDKLQGLDEAFIYLQRLTRDLFYKPSESYCGYARRHLSRLSEMGLPSLNQDYISALYGLSYKDELRTGQPIPDYVNKDIVQQVIRQSTQHTLCTLSQQGNKLWLQAKPSHNTDLTTHLPLATINMAFDQLSIQQGNAPARNVYWQNGQPLADLNPNQSITLNTALERLSLISMTKPEWASAIQRNQQGVEAVLVFNGVAYTAMWQEGNSSKEGAWQFAANAPVGFDNYGLYADLAIKQTVQRFRFIKAGTFMMGSPEDEKGRYDWEDLHQVTLTQGFWLADTPVTQAQWQAVIGGKNPSSFKGDDLPAEQVSWLDAHKFITELKTHNAALKAALPSEAQWEYACRAGTQTPFNFKGDVSLDRVNYSGKFDESGYEEEALQKTSTIKSYTPNRWGLYDMHGNVWEWCQDEWTNSLGTHPVTDPQNQSGEQQASGQEQDKAGRVVRGGSWFINGRDVRSAIRDYIDPGYRYYDVGFRLFLGLELQSSQESRDKLSKPDSQQYTARASNIFTKALKDLGSYFKR